MPQLDLVAAERQHVIADRSLADALVIHPHFRPGGGIHVDGGARYLQGYVCRLACHDSHCAGHSET